jgi:hypothetical protein
MFGFQFAFSLSAKSTGWEQHSDGWSWMVKAEPSLLRMECGGFY